MKFLRDIFFITNTEYKKRLEYELKRAIAKDSRWGSIMPTNSCALEGQIKSAIAVVDAEENLRRHLDKHPNC